MYALMRVAMARYCAPVRLPPMNAAASWSVLLKAPPVPPLESAAAPIKIALLPRPTLAVASVATVDEDEFL